MDYSKITDNPKVIELLKQRIEIENKIKEIDETALIKHELELLDLPVVVESLPSNKKCMLEINREIALFPKNSGVDIQSFGFGFKKGVSWCHKEITK